MSTYQVMDHAGWMESNNRAANRLYAKRRGWKPQPETLTEFQRKVCDVLGMVGGGIYNAPISHANIDWSYGWGGVSVIWKHGMATFDFGELTTLVFLCHEARIRCDVSPAGPRMMRISFWQRSHTGSTPERHPNLNEAVTAFRNYLPASHRIIYRLDQPSSVDAVARPDSEGQDCPRAPDRPSSSPSSSSAAPEAPHP